MVACGRSLQPPRWRGLLRPPTLGPPSTAKAPPGRLPLRGQPGPCPLVVRRGPAAPDVVPSPLRSAVPTPGGFVRSGAALHRAAPLPPRGAGTPLIRGRHSLSTVRCIQYGKNVLTDTPQLDIIQAYQCDAATITDPIVTIGLRPCSIPQAPGEGCGFPGAAAMPRFSRICRQPGVCARPGNQNVCTGYPPGPVDKCWVGSAAKQPRSQQRVTVRR